MTPYEIMLSESQERMLAIIEKGHEDEVAAVFHKWGLNAVVIGDVTDTGIGHHQGRRHGRRRGPRQVAHRRLPDLLARRRGAGLYPRGPVGGPVRTCPSRTTTTPSCCSCWPRRPSPPSAGSMTSTT